VLRVGGGGRGEKGAAGGGRRRRRRRRRRSGRVEVERIVGLRRKASRVTICSCRLAARGLGWRASEWRSGR
jgi:hypothetical protein